MLAPVLGLPPMTATAGPAIRAVELTKDYLLHDGPRLLFRDLTRSLAGGAKRRTFRALDGVSFEVERGETLGVIGINGAGKSTILRLIAGISDSTSGRVEVEGSVASLLELGAGFDLRLTARENVELNGMLLGIPRARVRAEMDEILRWAEVEAHADAPLYTFSSGMSMRLGFAIAIRTGADILLFDEVLAVGDVAFQAKCLRTIEEFQQQGKTIVFVSHDLYDIANTCDRVLLLDHGRMEALGPPHEVIQRYWSSLVEEESRATVESGPLRVDFVNGKLYLWHGSIPLTKGFCGYTSFRSFVRWHESDKGKWTVLERSPRRFVAEGTLWGLPLRQRWSVELVGDLLRWDVEAEALAPLRIERQQANLMLSEVYNRYRSATTRWSDAGWFRRTVDDDWEVLYSCPPAEGPVRWADAGGRMPEVSFALRAPDPRQELAVVNSDLNFRGRLLQCRRLDERELEPGSPEWLLHAEIRVGV